MPEESDHPTLYSGMKSQCDFHVQSNHISNRLLAGTGVLPDEAMQLNQALESWSKTLPSYFQTGPEATVHYDWYLFARARLWWRFWNLQIILFRQIVLHRAMKRTQASQLVLPKTEASADTDNKCRDVAVQAAQSTIKSIHGFLGQVTITRLINWYAT